MTTVDQLTDEQVGRLWAEQNGNRRPGSPYPGWNWYWSAKFGYPPQKYHLPRLLYQELEADEDRTQSSHNTEAEAYAALGRALRAVWKQVPMANLDAIMNIEPETCPMCDKVYKAGQTTWHTAEATEGPFDAVVAKDVCQDCWETHWQAEE